MATFGIHLYSYFCIVSVLPLQLTVQWNHHRWQLSLAQCSLGNDTATLSIRFDWRVVAFDFDFEELRVHFTQYANWTHLRWNSAHRMSWIIKKCVVNLNTLFPISIHGRRVFSFPKNKQNKCNNNWDDGCSIFFFFYFDSLFRLKCFWILFDFIGNTFY